MPHPSQPASQYRRPRSRTLTAALALCAAAAGCFGASTPPRATSRDPAPSYVDDRRPAVIHDLYGDSARHATAR